MMNEIGVASEIFFESTLNLQLKHKDICDLSKTYVVSIDIDKDSQKNEFYFFMTKETIQKISDAFMFPEEVDEELIVDLLQESANQIAGNAKLRLEEADTKSTYMLGIPEYKGLYSDGFNEIFKHKVCYEVENSDIMIAMK